MAMFAFGWNGCLALWMLHDGESGKALVALGCSVVSLVVGLAGSRHGR